MDRNIIEFAQFIERTRKASEVSRAESCEGIVSTRQYQRYRSEERRVGKECRL